MTKKPIQQQSVPVVANRRNRTHGVVLLLTLVIMVVLTMLVYTVTTQTTAQRYRSRYFMDYAKARYGCESGMKQALAYLPSGSFEPSYADRANEPDFSDLFCRTDNEVKLLIEECLEQYPDESWAQSFDGGIDGEALSSAPQDSGFGADDLVASSSLMDKIKGPYGEPWPIIMRYEFSEDFLGEGVRAIVEIEDENAKFPMTWLVMDDPNNKEALEVSFETFGEWMDLSSSEMDDIEAQMEDVIEIKAYQTEFEEEEKSSTASSNSKASTARRRLASRRGKDKTTDTQTKKLTEADYKQRRDRDYANLFNSNLLDLERLAQPTYESGSRRESALKYMGRWGHNKVNINSAPQQVLEAALVFGGDAVPVAAEIIRQRQEEPFQSMDDLTDRLSDYADHLKMCEDFITTESTTFTVRVTAYSGMARVSSIAAIVKSSGTSGTNVQTSQKLKTLAIISE